MKKLLPLIALSLACVTAAAQPTSFGGITPGQTTREELKGLVKNPGEVGKEDYSSLLKLKQPDDQLIEVRFHNSVVYSVKAYLSDFRPELKLALIEKYGQPNIKVGAITTVTCRNKLGASFTRLDGSEELQWPVKDGLQGVIRRLAGDCSEYISESYLLRHVATVQEVEAANLERRRKEAEEKRNKLGNAY